MSLSIRKQMQERIDSSQSGSAFIAQDFIDLAPYNTIKQNLKRLNDDLIIKRALPGIYYKPKFSNLLNEYIPASPEEISKAIARNFNWTIAPEGNTALNMLGLSTQMPYTYTYISSGPYRTYDFNGIQLKFEHRTSKDIEGFSELTALIIQALKALGKEEITTKHIDIIKSRLNSGQKKMLLEEGKKTASWVYEYIKLICSEDSNV